MNIKYNSFSRACDIVEPAHKAKIPFGLNKINIIKVSFYSLYQALHDQRHQFIIIGDNLPHELLDFFKLFKDVIVDNKIMGSTAKSLQKQIDLALNVPNDKWVYMCEDDYFHMPYSFQYISKFITNKTQYL